MMMFSPMPKLKESSLPGGEPSRKSFITIDDCIQLAQELHTCLRDLAVQKHPLDIRKGVVPAVSERLKGRNSSVLKAATRTYFFDVKMTRTGKRYLVITESRIKDRQRTQLTLFPEDCVSFLTLLQRFTDQLAR